MIDNFCIFILTHGRPDRIYTLNTIIKMGYTGKYYLIIDDEDKTIDKYIENFGEDKIIIFNKTEISKKFDTMDIFRDNKTIVYARNFCFEIAKKLKIEYFIELDDDYTSIDFRFNYNRAFKHLRCKISLDLIIKYMLDYYKKTNITCLAIAQNGDFIGGENGWMGECIRSKRKAMNFLLCSTNRSFNFIGRINEDVNTYVLKGSQGNLFMTLNLISISQKDTQQQKGGMSEVYLSCGTYVKSFYTVICCPSCTKIAMMGEKHRRIHHKIKWKNAIPMILSEKYKKI